MVFHLFSLFVETTDENENENDDEKLDQSNANSKHRIMYYITRFASALVIVVGNELIGGERKGGDTVTSSGLDLIE